MLTLDLKGFNCNKQQANYEIKMANYEIRMEKMHSF